MQPYHDLVERIMKTGVDREDRTGTGTRSIFGHQMRFPLTAGYPDWGGFPLLTTKHTSFKLILTELIWFLRGGTNIKWLNANGVHIWDEWADENGELGPVYGRQWRSWPSVQYIGERVGNVEIDQIANVIKSIKENPFSRRHIVTAWNPAEVDDMALPPCHTMFQFNVRPGDEGQPAFLDCQLYQRSGDVFLGVPFNIASYALLTNMIAHLTELTPGEFVHTLGDAHIYRNHFEQVGILLNRDPHRYPLPRVSFQGKMRDINEFNLHNVKLDDYRFFPAIKAPIAV